MDARLCKRLCKWVCKVNAMSSEVVDLSTWAESIQAYAPWLANQSNDAAPMTRSVNRSNRRTSGSAPSPTDLRREQAI